MKELSPARFRSLPENAKLKVGTRIITKGEIKALIERAKSAEFAKLEARKAKISSELDARRRTAEQQHKTEAESHNSRLLAQFESFRIPGNAAQGGSPVEPPVITEVAGVAKYGYLLMVKGTGFGQDQGSATLAGNFVQSPFALSVVKWSPNALVLAVGGSKGPDQDARLRVTRKNGAASNEYTVQFRTIYDWRNVDFSAGQITCSDQAFENICKIGGFPSPGLESVHYAMPTGATYSGTDSAKIMLKNGWKYEYYVCSERTNTELSIVGGKNKGLLEEEMSIVYNWTIQTPYVATISSEDLTKYYSSASCSVTIMGPEGTPYH